MCKCDNKPFTRVTVEQNDYKIIYEVPYEDVSGEDMMHIFETLMIGMTFPEKAIHKSAAEYIEEYAYDEYEVHEKCNDEGGDED